MITEENYKEATLALWGHLAEHDHVAADDETIHNLKNRILEELGYGRCMNGCPLCEAQKRWKIKCILSASNETCMCEAEGCQYRAIFHDFMNRGGIIHFELAAKFLEELKLKFTEQKEMILL